MTEARVGQTLPKKFQTNQVSCPSGYLAKIPSQQGTMRTSWFQEREEYVHQLQSQEKKMKS